MSRQDENTDTERSEEAKLIVLRGRKKASLTRAMNDVNRLMAEEEVEEVNVRLEGMKAKFRAFEDAHDCYHNSLTEENALIQSDEYYYKTQDDYINFVKKTKIWLRSTSNADHLQSSQQDHDVSNLSEANSSHNMDQLTRDVLSMINLPKVELDAFDGDPMNFHAFFTLFDENVHNVVSDDKVRLTRLLQYTTGKAKEAIRSCALLGGEAGYKQARKILTSRFGDDHIISERIIRDLKNGKPVKSPSELRLLADELQNGCAILDSMGKLRQIDTQSSIIAIADRLQSYIRNRWRRHALEVKRQEDEYPDFRSFVEFVINEAEVASDPVYGSWNVKSTFASDNKKKLSTSSFAASTQLATTRRPCVVCSGDHRLFWCDQFKAMKPTERLKVVKDNKLCENCLLHNHVVSNCRKMSTCSVPGCGLKHTKFIHINDRRIPQSPTSVASVNSAGIDSNITQQGNLVCIPIVPVRVNNKYTTCAVLDTGSSGSFCTRKLVEAVGVQGLNTQYTLNTLSKTEEVKDALVVNLCLKSVCGNEELMLKNVYVIDSIPVNNPIVNVAQYDHLSGLPINVNGSVDVLIGQDHAEALIPLEVKRGKVGDPFAVHTFFGWSLNGPLTSMNKVGKRVVSHFVTTKQIERDIQELWSVEHDNIVKEKVSMSVEDEEVLKLWDEKTELVDNHYQIPIPFKENVTIHSNITVALSRLESLRKSLIRRGLYEKYDDEVVRLCINDYAEKIPLYDVNCNSGTWYLPHQAVISEKKAGKLRVVFDCSSKYLGKSLNDVCLRGPDLTNKLQHVLLRFRTHSFAVSADIEAMYYQVLVPPFQRDYLRFLWFNPDGVVDYYRMKVHVFGGVWSGSAATYALRRTVEEYDASAIVCDAVKNAFYVDDLLISVPSVQDAVEVISGVKTLLSHGGFNLTKFIANSEYLLSVVNDVDKAAEVKELSSGCNSKVLGISWNVKSDSLFFEFKIRDYPDVTRRIMLSTVSSLFDPIGLIAPVLIEGRVLFQDATRMKLSWDEPVSECVSNSWKRWIRSLEDLQYLMIPRCVKASDFKDAYAELHHFSDASQKSYGCCSYLRCISRSGKLHVALLYGKGKVAPLKSLSIPRLELQAAVLAARVDSMLKEELDLTLGVSRFWTDSEIVLRYINNESRRFHVFVANRIGEIHSLTKPSQWGHVAGDINPADLVTRGMCPVSLKSSNWFMGPDFLHRYKCDWSDNVVFDDNNLGCDDPEIKRENLNVGNVRPNVVSHNVEAIVHPLNALICHYSQWYKLKRAVAWLLRFKNTLLCKVKNKEPLSVKEVQNAEIVILKHVQSQYFSSEVLRLSHEQRVGKSSHIKDLLPMMGNDGLLRVGGRIKNALFEFDCKHPIIVPHKSPVAVLIAREAHEVAHMGVEWTLGRIRARYWITRPRSLLRRIKGQCVTCRKMHASPCVQRMAHLPTERVLPGHPPFSFVGTDCFGPIMVRVGRSQVKRYGCIFTCFTTRAVHVEVLHSMETDSLINALRRFMSRRGTPKKIWSDNGTNFVGCYNELRRSLKQLENSKINAFCVKQNIEWVFNPPCAPHMGGVFERMVQTVKRTLYSILCNARLTDEVLCTFLCETENLINGRPITKVSSDGSDPAALTPNHLLLLKGDSSPLPGDFDVADIYRRRWRHVQQLSDTFWRRWVKDYLPQLQKACKWRESQRNLQVNDVVLVVDELTPRGLWPLGIVTDVKKSDDGLVRTVSVKTKATELVRPVTKLVWLEANESS